jgi:hypothetical protein
MTNEAFIQSIVRSVIERLEAKSEDLTPTAPGGAVATRSHGSPEPLTQLYQAYRGRYLSASPFEEKFCLDFDSPLPLELGRPLFCIYETHQPCDSCGRCQVRGF